MTLNVPVWISTDTLASPSTQPLAKSTSDCCIALGISLFEGAFVGSLVDISFCDWDCTFAHVKESPSQTKSLQQYSPTAHDFPSGMHWHRPLVPHILEQQNESVDPYEKHHWLFGWHVHLPDVLHPPWQHLSVDEHDDLSALQVGDARKYLLLLLLLLAIIGVMSTNKFSAASYSSIWGGCLLWLVPLWYWMLLVCSRASSMLTLAWIKA